jgi:hypothetical protein
MKLLLDLILVFDDGVLIQDELLSLLAHTRISIEARML